MVKTNPPGMWTVGSILLALAIGLFYQVLLEYGIDLIPLFVGN